MEKYRYTILTLITNNYEIVREVPNPQEDVEYLLITDSKEITSSTWNVIYEPLLDNPYLTPQEKIFYIKWGNIFNYVHSDVVIRIDGSLQLHESLDNVVNTFNKCGYDLACMLHPERFNLLDEYDAWINVRELDKVYKERFINLCLKTKYDLSTKGLVETTMVIMRNNDICKNFVSTIYNVMESNNALRDKNDQCYFTYVLTKYFKEDIKVWFLSEQVIFSKYMTWCLHGTNDVITPIYSLTDNFYRYIFDVLMYCNKFE